MVAAVDISLQFGGRYLFKNISFRVGPHDRIGLVGSNGAGKTTLLRLLLGEASADSGEISRAKYVTVGYLPQEGIATQGKTLYAEAESVFGDILQTQERLAAIHRRMGELDHESEEFQELLEVYGELQHKLEGTEAFRMKATIEKVLVGLGFTQEDFHRQTGEFSGGWQMRIALAKLLLLQPSLLLLDEPTNHLDLDSLQWLEDYLRSYEGAVIIVSHDSRFLDNMTSKTLELSLGNLTEYAGNFSFFVEARAERREQQLAAFKNQQQQIRQTERFIERFRYKATKARQVQSRIKRLAKLDRVEVEDEESGIHFLFPPGPSSGRVAMELRSVQKSYGAHRVFDGLSLDIDRGDRIAFVGANGTGKSTLARIIAGVEPLDGGERKAGHNVLVSYFAQDQADELNPESTVLQTVDDVAAGEIRKHLRSLLGSFLFSGDDVNKRVSVLSGGERSRLALAKMLLTPSNLIVMDEPTNHLDMRSKGVLQEALMEFEGSLVIVSHDRDFLDPIVSKVVEFKATRIKTYVGSVSDYIDAKQREAAAGTMNEHERGSTARGDERARKRLEAERRQRRYERVKPLKDKLERLEQVIESREEEKRECERLMADPEFYKDGERVREVTTHYKELEKALQDDYYRWMGLSKELEQLDSLEETRKER